MSKAFLVSSFLASLKRHWWVAAATFSSTLVGAVAYLMVTPPEYETDLRVMLDEQQVSISDLGQSLTELNANVAIGVDPFATQSEIITSKTLVARALDVLSDDISGEDYEFSDADVDDVADRIMVRVVPATNILELSLIYPEPDAAAAILNAIAQSAIQQNVEDIRLGASSVRQFLESKIPEEQIRLELAEAAERDYRQTYGILSIEDQTLGLIDSLGSLDSELRTLTAQLQEAVEREALLGQVTNSQSLRAAYTATRVGQNETLQDLQRRLTDLEAGVIEAQTRLGDQHPDLLALKEQRQQLRTFYSQELGRVGAVGGPEAYRATAPISSDFVSRYILGQIERQALEQRLLTIQTQKSILQEQANLLSTRQQPLAALVRQREEAEENLRNLLGKLEEARIAEAQLISNLRIVSTAEIPDEPTEPSAPVVLFLGMVVGSLLAGGAVFLLDLFDSSIRSVDDIEVLLDLPVLGVLPPLPAEQSGVERWDQFIEDPSFVEPYRRLLKKIERLHQEQASGTVHPSFAGVNGDRPGLGQHTIVFTSALDGEGKSAVTAHLGIVAGLLSRRALIIDGDQYRPVQDLFFNVPSYPGLSEVVLGGKDLNEAVQPTALEKLDLLPQGKVAARPSAMAESLAMKAFLDDTHTPYNWVLIDASSISQSADASTYSTYSDGIVLVVRPEFVQKQALQYLVEDLQESGATILGVVISGAILPEEEDAFTVTQRRSPTPPNRFALGGKRS